MAADDGFLARMAREIEEATGFRPGGISVGVCIWTDMAGAIARHNHRAASSLARWRERHGDWCGCGCVEPAGPMRVERRERR